MNPIRNFAPEAAAVTVAELHRRLLKYLKQRFSAKIRRGIQELYSHTHCEYKVKLLMMYTINVHYGIFFMTSVNVTELRQRLPEYLKQVQRGEEVVITLHGKTIARIVPDRQENAREAALNRLKSLQGTVICGDILAPLDEAWTGDADNLSCACDFILGRIVRIVCPYPRAGAEDTATHARHCRIG
jgi:prevent-host-death family protein